MTEPAKRAMTPEDYLADAPPEALAIFDELRDEVKSMGGVEVRATKAQIAFWRSHPFAWAWRSAKYLGERADFAPLVLSVDLTHRDGSSRWKQVVEPRPGHFMHHLELRSVAEIDDEVRGWLKKAWERAG